MESLRTNEPPTDKPDTVDPEGTEPVDSVELRCRTVGLSTIECRPDEDPVESEAVWITCRKSVGEIRRSDVAILDPFREGLETDPFQLGWKVERRSGGAVAARRRAPVAEVRGVAARAEGNAAAKHLVEHHSQTVDVGAPVDAVGRSGDLLGRHVGRRARDESQLAAAGRRVIECTVRNRPARARRSMS